MMKKGLLFIAILFAGAQFFSSCKDKQNPPPESIDYSYFPLDSGRYFIYQVDSVVYNAFTKLKTTSSSQLKDIIGESITDNSGRKLVIVSRYRRANDSLQWTADGQYTIQTTTTTAEMVEDNVRFIKLVFPIKQGESWNGNAYNSNEPWIYKFTEVNENATVLSNNYPGTATVLQHDEENLIKKIYSLEKYAVNTGLVYKEYINDSSDVSSDTLASTPFEDRITGGVEIRMYLLSTGK